jgi:hypothetical protein
MGTWSGVNCLQEVVGAQRSDEYDRIARSKQRYHAGDDRSPRSVRRSAVANDRADRPMRSDAPRDRRVEADRAVAHERGEPHGARSAPIPRQECTYRAGRAVVSG